MTATIEELPSASTPGRSFTLRRSVREALWGLIFISPWLVGLILFTAGPMIASFAMSLTDFNLVKPDSTKIIWTDNYVRALSDRTIPQSLISTFKYALIAIPFT